MAERNLPKQLYINSFYNLNNSNSKVIAIGLQKALENENFVPTISLGGVSQNVSLTVEEWKLLQEQFEEIASFLNDNGSTRWKQPITIGEKVNVIFTTSYNSKTIIIEKSIDNCNQNNKFEEEPQKKKVCMYVPYVNFKKVTFDNLIRISSLINTKIVYLQNVSESVKNCEKIFSKCINDGTNDKMIIKEKIMDVMKNDKFVNNDAVFSDMYNELCTFLL